MARSRQLALVLVCGAVTIAGWDAARLGGFEWSGIENIATPIWNRGAARGATISSTDAGPVGAVGALLAHARASASAAIRSHRKVPEPDGAAAAMDGDRIDALKVIEPRLDPFRISEPDKRRAIQVEYSAAALHDPSTLRDQPVLDQHRLPRRPSHLLDMPIFIQPDACRDALDEAKASIDAPSRP